MYVLRNIKIAPKNISTSNMSKGSNNSKKIVINLKIPSISLIKFKNVILEISLKNPWKRTLTLKLGKKKIEKRNKRNIYLVSSYII